LPVALSLARRSKAALEIMHVHQFLDGYYAELQPVSDTLERSLRKQEKVYLEKTAERLRDASPVAVTTVLQDGQVAAEIRHHALERNVSLVILATHARGAFGRFWLGSAADELVRELPMPVLLVHPSENDVDLKRDLAFKNIVIPLDGSELAEQILVPAVAMAKLFGAEITLLRVVQPLVPTSVPVGMGTFSTVALHMADDVARLQKQLEQQAFAYLDKVDQKLRGDKLVVKTHVVLADQPGVGVLREAEALGADLIALATHGRRGLSRLLLGSVADKVLRGSPVAVLLHRPTHG
jgi:nucleotide-binding universal stress UspA family protein